MINVRIHGKDNRIYVIVDQKKKNVTLESENKNMMLNK